MAFLFRYRNIAFTCLFIGLCCSAFPQGYNITIHINNLKDTLMLGHYFSKKSMLISDDTAVIVKGTAIFKGKKPLPRGVYFIHNGKSILFDIMMGDDQQFVITSDTSDYINKTTVTSSEENQVFFDFQKYNAEREPKFMALNQQLQKTVSDEEKANLHTQILALYNEHIEYLQKTIDTHKNLYVSKFFASLIPMDSKLPDPPKDAEGRITDSMYVYRWYREHFFDNLNIFDPDMLRTPFYEDKLMQYITQVVPQHPDSINAEADKILSKAQANPDVFSCILITLFNYYVKSNIMGYENVWVHLADKWYIPYATWSDSKYIETLKKEVKLKAPNLIGKPAPPIEMLMVLPPEHFKAAMLDTAIKNDLHAGVMINDFRQSIKSKYLLLFFWDINCGHCKKTIIELHKAYEEYKGKGLQVLAIQAILSKEAKQQWIDYVNEHNLFGWINAWSPYSYQWRDLYDVSSFPSFYLLDEKKIIIGRRLDVDIVKKIIDQYTK